MNEQAESVIVVDPDDEDLKQTIHGTKVEEQQKPVPFTKLISLAYPERYILFVALVLMIIAEGLGLVIPLLIANAYDALVDLSLTPSQRMSDINAAMIYALVLHVVGVAAHYLRSAIMGAAGVRIVGTDPQSIVSLYSATRNCLFRRDQNG